MRFLSEYTSESLPTIQDVAVPNDYCTNTESIRPYDVSSIKSVCDSKCQEISDGLSDFKNTIDEQLRTLDDMWGSKFISMNGVGLGMVNIDKFTEIFNKLVNEINSMKKECDSLCSSIEDGTRNVNNGLDQLRNNYNTYLYYQKMIENDPSSAYGAPAFSDLTNGLVGEWVKGG